MINKYLTITKTKMVSITKILVIHPLFSIAAYLASCDITRYELESEQIRSLLTWHFAFGARQLTHSYSNLTKFLVLLSMNTYQYILCNHVNVVSKYVYYHNHYNISIPTYLKISKMAVCALVAFKVNYSSPTLCFICYCSEIPPPH